MREFTELVRKLHGWHRTYRGIFLLLRNEILTKEEFILYNASLSFSDWDKVKTTYGSFDLSQEEIQNLLGFTGGYVSKHGKKLFKLGLWQKRRDKRTQVDGFDLIEARLLKEIATRDKLIDLEAYLGISQTPLANSQETIANKQTTAAKEEQVNQAQKFANKQTPSPKPLLSSKDKHIRMTVEESKEIIKSGNYKSSTPDDLRWIERNLGGIDGEGEEV